MPPRDPKTPAQIGRSTFEQLAIDRLRAHGYRITRPRVQVVRALADSDQALSAYGIHAKIIEEGGRIDVVSVYRILTALADIHLVHHIGVVDGYLACRMDEDHSKQMEHVVCQQCGSVQELEVPAVAIEATEAQLKNLGFIPENIKIEVLGKCTDCSAGH